MPQDTAKYRDRYVQSAPVEVDSLFNTQLQYVTIVHDQKKPITYSGPSGTYLFFIIFIIVFSAAAIYSRRKTQQSTPVNADRAFEDDRLPIPISVYPGNKLKFSDELILAVLIKRYPFYNTLNKADKQKFLKRLKRFIPSKVFVIHNMTGYKEMPILISATAVQISFGLDKYLLPNFDTFNIYPNEFIGTYPFVRYLIGNVTGNTISLSWKHFLEGFSYPNDGQNVGMHEIAHALYYQTFVVEKNVDTEFRDTFIHFDSHGNKVYDMEKTGGPALYTTYAMKDFQEFWAESVEIFFERPLQMKASYPHLYAAMSDLLNQDPAMASSGNAA